MMALTDDTKLGALRAIMRGRGIDAMVIPANDEHQMEFPPARERRLEWLTEFRGSAGTAVVTARKATLFVDKRYFLDASQQFSGSDWECVNSSDDAVECWLSEAMDQGDTVAIDPWLHTHSWVNDFRTKLHGAGLNLAYVERNPIDSIWSDRPPTSNALIEVQPIELAGSDVKEKLATLARHVRAVQAQAMILVSLESIAWLFNIRSRDSSFVPVTVAYAIVTSSGDADLFVSPEKITPAVREHLSQSVNFRDYVTFATAISSLNDQNVAIDFDQANTAIFGYLEDAQATILACPDPVVAMKAAKNLAEMTGQRAAHVRDGAALCSFLHWLSVQPPSSLTELEAAEKLLEIRRGSPELVGLSFPTISATGPNAASPHYIVSRNTNRMLADDDLYLVDSGGQYREGTTDVTRTVAIGVAGAERRNRFTQVLKGHIALANAIFPAGTSGGQLDALARQYLWRDGLDYAHNTGHGVGAFLAVHEGPHRIGKKAGGDVPLVAGMIVSIEPGYYRAGDFGIRIENLYEIVPRYIAGAEQPMLGFDALTLAPIDRALIDFQELTDIEIKWINGYHSRVCREIGVKVSTDVAQWLEQVCRSGDESMIFT